MRTDGSVFTVTVPRHGMDDRAGHRSPGRPWISDDSGRSGLSLAGLFHLGAAVGMFGGHPGTAGRRH